MIAGENFTYMVNCVNYKNFKLPEKSYGTEEK